MHNGNFSGHIMSYFRHPVGMIACFIAILSGTYYYLGFIDEKAEDEKAEDKKN